MNDQERVQGLRRSSRIKRSANEVAVRKKKSEERLKEPKKTEVNVKAKMKTEVKIKKEISDAPSVDTSTSGVLVGGHVSIQGGLHEAVRRALEDGSKAFALFLKSQRQWSAKPLDKSAADMFRAALETSGISPHAVVPHGSYLINLGSPDAEKLNKSREAHLDEVRRCEMLGLPLHNVHPGSSCGEGTVEECLGRIAESINMTHSHTKFCITLIENMSCQGNTVGGRFEELRAVIEGVEDKARVGVCLDTCHAFAAGYDLSTEEGYEETIREFDSIVGLSYLKAIHLNDSQGKLGCHLDRHEKIGKGQIGLGAFRRLVNDPRMRNIPMVLETPLKESEDSYEAEVSLLWSLVAKS